jgi:two-component system nitrogen regulation sensor histidine kinase NtrY
MSYSHFTSSLLFRLFIFTLLVAAATLLLFLREWLYTVPVLMLLAYSLWNIIYFVNGINRKLAYFFDAIKNEDSTLHFPEDAGNKSLQALHKSFNRINSLISEIKIKHEHNQRFFQEFMKQSATGIMVVDEKGFVEIINARALGFCGLGYLSHIQRLAQCNKLLYEALKEAQPGQSYSLKWLNGQEIQQLSLKVVPLHFREKNYRVYSLYDIKSEMEETELETWQKLIRVLTHEIMNSIAPITSLSNTLSKFYIKNGKRVLPQEISQQEVGHTVEGLAIIEERGEGLIHFVDNYRKLTKVPKPVFKPVNIAEWLRTVEWLAASRMEEEKIKLKVSHSGIKESFLADEKLLTQVILNLLNNAADALINTQNKCIQLVVEEGREEKLKIRITDNGPGFGPEELENLFIPFYTTKENGSGIGLSLSRQIMRLHKGSISARSVPGRETTFELLF